MNVIKVISTTLLILSLGLGYYLVDSIKTSIDEKKLIAEKEAKVIEKLKFIREAQLVFREVNGRYTDNWTELVNFIQHGVYYNISRSETIIPLSYGRDSILVSFDTLGSIPAKERIYKRTFAMDASDNGTFMGYMDHVKIGNRITKGQKAYSIRTSTGTNQPIFPESGVVETLNPIESGTDVRKGKQLITYWSYRFDPNMSLNDLDVIPDSEGKKFAIFVDKKEKNGVIVDVIEVRDTHMHDKLRKESNEAANRKPLRFGSKSDVTTAGNWE
jgi:hypothetical protein